MPNDNDNKLVTLADLGEAYNALYARDVMEASDKTKLDGIEAGAQVNTVTSVNSQTGAVSLTPANIGAVNKAGDTMTGILTAAAFSIAYDDFQILNMKDLNGVETSHIRSHPAERIIVFREWTPNASMAYEDYYLPPPTNQNGAVVYSILTNKSPVTVAQGGTGATTPAQARANLELTPSAFQMIATGIYVMKIGNLAFINCVGISVIALPPATWVTLGYLPNGYVPSGNFYGTILNGNMGQQQGIMNINESGAISYFNSGIVQETALWGSMIFPISNN